MPETCALDPTNTCQRVRCPGPDLEILTVPVVTLGDKGPRDLANEAFKVLAVICPDNRERMVFTPQNFEEGSTDGR